MKIRRATHSLLAIFAAAIAAAALVSCLPEDPYRRFQLLDGTEYRNLRWVYERTHFDPRPVDIAVLGSSRIETGVDARQLEATLRAAGSPLHVENFGIPYNGRNLDLVIARQLLATKKPKVLIIGVPERPSQHTHVTFKYVGSSSDVVTSFERGNFEYLADLAYLPYRHLQNFGARLFGTSAVPVKPGNEAHYDPDMGFKREPGGRWDVTYPQRALIDLKSGARRALLERSGSPLLKVALATAWSAERRNVAAITDLARARKIAVVFLFIPQFASDGVISDAAFYRKHGPLLDADFVSTHPELYSSWGHLNARGATVLNVWLVGKLSDMGLLVPKSAPANAIPAGGERPRAR